MFHKTNWQIWPVWNLENSFTKRLSTRVGLKRHAEMIFMLLMMLQGSSIFYYGSELGMEDGSINTVIVKITKFENFIEFLN